MYLDHVVVCSNTKLFSQQLNRLRIVNDLSLALPLYLLSLDFIFPILSQFLFFPQFLKELIHFPNFTCFVKGLI